jgi:hypothetical protein
VSPCAARARARRPPHTQRDPLQLRARPLLLPCQNRALPGQQPAAARRAARAGGGLDRIESAPRPRRAPATCASPALFLATTVPGYAPALCGGLAPVAFVLSP